MLRTVLWPGGVVGVRCDETVTCNRKWAVGWKRNTHKWNSTNSLTSLSYFHISDVFHCESKSHIPVEQHERNHKISGSIKAAATKKERQICKRKKKAPLKLSYFFTYMHSFEFVVSQHQSQTFIWISPFSLKDYRLTTLEQGCCLPGNLTANPQPLPYKSLPW